MASPTFSSEALCLLELLDEAALLVGPDACILQINNACENLLGFKNADIIGKTLDHLLAEDSQNLANMESKLLTASVKLKTKEHGELSVQFKSACMIQEQKPLRIAVLKRAETTQHNEESEVAENASLCNEHLAFILTHELKGPLLANNTLLSHVNELEYGEISGELSSILTKLQESNSDLLFSIQNLLEICRNEKFAESMDFEAFDLTQLVSNCTSEFAMLAYFRNLFIEVSFAAREGIIINADYKAIHRVMSNLLNNAIKYSPDCSSIKISVTKTDSEACLHIHNQGQCLSPQEQQLLFQPFRQGRLGKRCLGGSGLGLYLCHRVIETHKGRVSCSSNSDGTSFSLCLPLSKIQS